MRNLLLALFVICIAANVATSQINENALILQKMDVETKTTYYKDIKKFAEKEWKDDHVMMVHVINEQSNALVDFIGVWASDTCDKDIMLNAVEDWGRLMPTLSADWIMVMHQYKSQLKAKGGY